MGRSHPALIAAPVPAAHVCAALETSANARRCNECLMQELHAVLQLFPAASRGVGGISLLPLGVCGGLWVSLPSTMAMCSL